MLTRLHSLARDRQNISDREVNLVGYNGACDGDPTQLTVSGMNRLELLARRRDESKSTSTAKQHECVLWVLCERKKRSPNDQNRTGDQSISEDTENSINHYSRSLYHLSYARSRTPHFQHVLYMCSHTNDTSSRHLQHIANRTRQVSSSYHAYSPQDITTDATL